MMRSSLIPGLLLLMILTIPASVTADQPLPFSPLGNVTGNYNLTQGNDTWIVNTNMPLSNEDVVYPEVLFYLIVIIGIAFLILATVFISFSDHVPSIAILMSGILTAGCEAVAAVMSAKVGRIDTFSQVIAGIPNVIYTNQIVTFTLSPQFAYACAGLAVAGAIVAIAGGLSHFGYFQRKGLGQAQKGDYLEQDISDPEDEEAIRYRKGSPRK